MRNYTITAEIEVAAGEGVAYPQIEIDYGYTKGNRATGPSYSCGGTPADPAEVEFIAARLIWADGLSPTQAMIDEWAGDYLESDAGYCAAINSAIECIADQRADRRRALRA